MRLILKAALLLTLGNSMCVSACMAEECTRAPKQTGGCPQHPRAPRLSLRCSPQPAATTSTVDLHPPEATAFALSAAAPPTAPDWPDRRYDRFESPPGAHSLFVLLV